MTLARQGIQQTAGVSTRQVRHLHRPAESHWTFQSAAVLGRTEHRGTGFPSDVSKLSCILQFPISLPTYCSPQHKQPNPKLWWWAGLQLFLTEGSGDLHTLADRAASHLHCLLSLLSFLQAAFFEFFHQKNRNEVLPFNAWLTKPPGLFSNPASSACICCIPQELYARGGLLIVFLSGPRKHLSEKTCCPFQKSFREGVISWITHSHCYMAPKSH